MTSQPTPTTRPVTAAAAVDAAAEAIYEVVPITRKSCDEIAASVLAAALDVLLPGLYVTHEQLSREGADSIIWAERPDRPSMPDALLMRTEANARLFDAVAALLPDRTSGTD